MMKNLLINKIRYFIEKYGREKIDEQSYIDGILTEIQSGDTKANIKGLFNILNQEILVNGVKINGKDIENVKHINLHIISSSFHLLEICDKLIDFLNGRPKPGPWEKPDKSPLSLAETSKILIKKLQGRSCDLYLIGTENPKHVFTSEQLHEIKLLFNAIFYKSFKPPK
jgi:hypothetical protein